VLHRSANKASKRPLGPLNYVVRSWGLPQSGKPDGAKSIGFGRYKTPYVCLTHAEREEPMMRSIRVPVVDTLQRNPQNGEKTIRTKSEKLVRKKLLAVKPFEYFERMSDPNFGLRERAALQFFKPRFVATHNLLESGLKELRTGANPTGIGALYRSKQCLHDIRNKSLSDILLIRYTQWAIGLAKSAKRVLRALGLSARELRNPLLTDFGPWKPGNSLNPRRPCRLFSVGEHRIPPVG